VQGTGETGFSFRQSDGGYVMRSPFTPGQNGRLQLVPAAGAAAYWAAAVQVVAQGAAQAGQPLPDNLVNYLVSLQPTPAQISANYFNSVLNQSGSLSDLNLPDVDRIRESTSTTFEAGYRGVLGDQMVLTTDVWYSKRDNLVTPLTIFTPFVTLNPQQTGAFLQAALAQAGFPPEQIQALVTSLTPSLASVPLGVISAPEATATGPQLLATYTNVDESINLWGVDIGAEVLLADRWSVFGSASFVNDHNFETDSGLRVFLNAPKTKGTLGVSYGAADTPLNFEGRMRYTDGFPASSGVYEGFACILPNPGPEAQPCVESYTLLDLTAGYRLPGIETASLQLSVQNILDDEYQSFPGVPAVGRLALLRLKYDF
jgi:iron complex outermembrane receptor protein